LGRGIWYWYFKIIVKPSNKYETPSRIAIFLNSEIIIYFYLWVPNIKKKLGNNPTLMFSSKILFLFNSKYYS
jgi:hypothetical protein